MTKTPIRGLVTAILLSFCAQAHAITNDQAEQATAAFNKTYWNATGKYFYKNDNRTGVLDFWLTAHAWETIMDAYLRTGSDAYKQQIRDVYDGFVARQGTDWTRNNFNDDIAWWIIATSRAYEVTGESRYLAQAKTEFDWVYGTQRDPVNGGIFWKNNEHGEKNSCVVQPMIISAANLARLLKDDSYRLKAESLYTWQKKTLVSASGQVYDNIKTSGGISNYASTYNEGTFIGSGVLLGHLADAKTAADWTKKNMCNAAGVLRESGQGDVGGFKLICARYVMSLSKQPGNAAYADWMETNAEKVWSNRRADGVMGYDWNNPAPSSGIECQSAAGGVSLMNLLATANVGINPALSASRGRAGSVASLSASGKGAASIWLFGKTPFAELENPGNGGLRANVSRIDGRASALAPR